MAVKANATITLSFMVDVKAVYRYYKLQASTASAPEVPTTAIPIGWTDSEPTYTEGSTNTLYTVDKTVFTNDTFAYSAVSKSTSYEAAKAAYNKAVNAQSTANNANDKVDNLEIGGRNLIIGSESIITDFTNPGNRGETLVDNGYRNCKAIATTSGWSGPYIHIKDIADRNNLSEGDVVTVSIYVSTDSETEVLSPFITLYRTADNGTSAGICYDIGQINLKSGKWVKISKTFPLMPDGISLGNTMRFEQHNDTTYCILWSAPILELGNKASDWTPAPEDVDTAIDDAAKTATNFMQFVDGEGLYVGNKQSGTWEGVRTRMDTDSFDVIDQDGNTLASYGAEMSITPNNTSGYKIKMGNAVTIGTRYPNSTEGYGSVVLGYLGRATSSYSYAEGYTTLASESYAHAEGCVTISSGDGSHAEGRNTTASGNGSHAEGDHTNATGMYSHAEGESTTASGEGAHAEGKSTEASGDYSHAEGNGTIASESCSHAEGESTEASGMYSHAEGYYSNASGSCSHAEGYETLASGYASHASGQGTKATGNYQFVIGIYNDAVDDAAFIIGNGASNNNSNALEVDWDGNMILSGNIYYNIPVCGSAYDVNAMKTTGKYYCGGSVANKPAEPGNASGSNGWLEVMNYDGNYVHQRYTTCNGDVYERNCINGTWGNWRVIFYHRAMTATTSTTFTINFVSEYPFTINIGVYSPGNTLTNTYSYTACYKESSQSSKINANTAALSSTYGTITAATNGIAITSKNSYKLYVTVTQ